MRSIAGAIQGVGNIATSLIQYQTAKNQLESQLRMAMAQYTHQDKLAGMSAEDQIDRLSGEVKKQEIIRNGVANLNKAVEGRKKAEDNLKIATAQVTEAKKTSRTGTIDTKLVDRMFHRTTYSYGKPLHT